MPSKPRKNQSGTYYITWSDSDRTPRQKTESLKTKKLGEARQRASSLQILYDNGYHDPWDQSWHKNKRITGFVYSGTIDLQKLAKKKVVSGVSTYKALEEYISYKLKNDWNSATTREYPKQLRRFARRLPKTIDQLTQDHFLDLLAGYDNDFTYASYAGTLNTFISWLKKYGLDIESIPYKKPRYKIPEFIYNDDLERICMDKIQTIKEGQKYNAGTSSHAWMILAWLVMRYTGCRPNELIRLKTTDIKLDRQELVVGSWFRTKTGDQRKIPLFKPALPVYQLLLDPAYRKTDPAMDNDLLFGRSFWSKKKLSKEFSDHSDRKLYWLRNTFAMWFLTNSNDQAAWHFYQLKKYMGHTKLNQTEKYLDALPYYFDKEKLHDHTFIPKILDEVILL